MPVIVVNFTRQSLAWQPSGKVGTDVAFFAVPGRRRACRSPLYGKDLADRSSADLPAARIR